MLIDKDFLTIYNLSCILAKYILSHYNVINKESIIMVKHFCIIRCAPFSLNDATQWQMVVQLIRKKDSFAYINLDAYGLFVKSKHESVINFTIETIENMKLIITEIDVGRM